MRVKDIKDKLRLSYLGYVDKKLFVHYPERIILWTVTKYTEGAVILSASGLEDLKYDVELLRSKGIWDELEEQKVLEYMASKKEFKSALKSLPIGEQIKYQEIRIKELEEYSWEL